MRYLNGLLGFLFLLAVVLFTYANTDMVSIQFVPKRYFIELPLAWALFGAFLLGVLLTFLLSLPRRLGSFYKRSQLEDDNKRLKNLLAKTEQELAQLKTLPSTAVPASTSEPSSQNG